MQAAVLSVLLHGTDEVRASIVFCYGRLYDNLSKKSIQSAYTGILTLYIRNGKIFSGKGVDKMLPFTRAIRKSASSMLSAASQLIFAHKMALPSWFLMDRFHASMESVHKNHE